MSLAAQPPAASQILLVEDEEVVRRELSRFLAKRGFAIVQAENGSAAISLARRGETGVVLMDLRLGGDKDIDGVEAAQEIQRIHPLTSFIFVSAFTGDQTFREKARQSKIRIGGWLEKPLGTRLLLQLQHLISKEQKKLEILGQLEQARERGVLPTDHLRGLAEQDSSLLSEILPELLEELAKAAGSEEALPDLSPSRRD